MTTARDVTAAIAKEGKYLTFALGREEYGLEILSVREIIGLMDITGVPQVPKYVKGVINLRGKVIPVIDLRLKFEMPSVDYTNETCIIVLNIQDVLIGILVDRVCEVLDIAETDIEPPPTFGTVTAINLIKGMGKIDGKVKILLNIEKILTEDLSIAAKIS